MDRNLNHKKQQARGPPGGRLISRASDLRFENEGGNGEKSHESKDGSNPLIRKERKTMKGLLSVLFVLLCVAFASPMASGDQAQDVAANETNPPAGAKININVATADELESLPNIGKLKAERIVEYRKENGDFKSPEDIINVKGIGEETLERIRDLIRVE